MTYASGQRIQVDFDTLTAAVSALTGASTPALPEPSPVRIAPIDTALTSIRDSWRTDALTGDATELGIRLSATARDFEAVEQLATRGLRALEAAF
jgi:hypothetical protein